MHFVLNPYRGMFGLAATALALMMLSLPAEAHKIRVYSGKLTGPPQFTECPNDDANISCHCREWGWVIWGNPKHPNSTEGESNYSSEGEATEAMERYIRWNERNFHWMPTGKAVYCADCDGKHKKEQKEKTQNVQKSTHGDLFDNLVDNTTKDIVDTAIDVWEGRSAELTERVLQGQQEPDAYKPGAMFNEYEKELQKAQARAQALFDLYEKLGAAEDVGAGINDFLNALNTSILGPQNDNIFVDSSLPRFVNNGNAMLVDGKQIPVFFFEFSDQLSSNGGSRHSHRARLNEEVQQQLNASMRSMSGGLEKDVVYLDHSWNRIPAELKSRIDSRVQTELNRQRAMAMKIDGTLPAPPPRVPEVPHPMLTTPAPPPPPAPNVPKVPSRPAVVDGEAGTTGYDSIGDLTDSIHYAGLIYDFEEELPSEVMRISQSLDVTFKGRLRDLPGNKVELQIVFSGRGELSETVPRTGNSKRPLQFTDAPFIYFRFPREFLTLGIGLSEQLDEKNRSLQGSEQPSTVQPEFYFEVADKKTSLRGIDFEQFLAKRNIDEMNMDMQIGKVSDVMYSWRCFVHDRQAEVTLSFPLDDKRNMPKGWFWREMKKPAQLKLIFDFSDDLSGQAAVYPSGSASS